MNSLSSKATIPLAKNPDSAFGLSGRGYRIKLLTLWYRVLFFILDTSDRLFGTAAIPILAIPFIAVDRIKREREFQDFVRLRSALPADFWNGLSPRDHYRRMVRDWYEGVSLALLYHRLGMPHWTKCFQISGQLPENHPEWGKRPVIFTFLHTGPFGLIPYWLRTRGLPVASLVGGLPLIVNNDHFQRIIVKGNARYGLTGVPHVFQRYGGLRDALRFLQPGRALAFALDGGLRADKVDRYDAGGLPIMIRQGAARVAAQSNSIVIPISIRRTANCRFRIHFGKPVPDEHIRNHNFTATTQHIISELWPGIQEDPGSLNWTTLEALVPGITVRRTSWP